MTMVKDVFTIVVDAVNFKQVFQGVGDRAATVHESPWRAIKVHEGYGAFMSGILGRVSMPLARAGIAIFNISSFDENYVLV